MGQDTKHIEISFGADFLFPINIDSDEGYLIGGSAGVGYIMSPIVVFSGSIVYSHFSSDGSEYLQEQPGSVLRLSVNVKRYIFQLSNNFKPYLLLEMGFFFPLQAESYYGIIPEISGGAGLEFLVSSNFFIFIDGGYCLGITKGDPPQFFLGSVGVNLHI